MSALGLSPSSRTAGHPGTTPDPDAPRRGEGLGYLPSLDGIRALAVLGVILYHAGIGWLPAGFLGVDTFFVLSGFLITTLLLQEVRHTATIRLVSFWARRARRLLPALLAMVALCAVFVWFVAAKGSYPTFRADAVGTMFYVANWHFIAEHANYFAATSPPSPLTHTWSLAIEEQFYVLWPLVLLGLTRLGRGVRTVAWLCALGAVASTIWMAVRFEQGASITRLYYGTDTHAQCVLVGAGLAALLAHRSATRTAAGLVPTGRSALGLGGDLGWVASTKRSRRALTWLGLGGVALGAVLWSQVSFYKGFLYDGGFLLMALSAAAVIASVVMHQRGILARALSISPLVFLGRISYGLYLWHFPLFIWLTPARTGLHGNALLALRLAAAFGVSVASFYLLERPIRRGSLLHGWRGLGATFGAIGATAGLVLGAAGASAAVAAAAAAPTASGKVVSAPTSGDPLRVYITGDSTALTLGMVMNNAPLLEKDHLSVHAHGFLGCGVVRSDQLLLAGAPWLTAPECQLHPAMGVVPAIMQVAAEEAAFKPDVVIVLAGRWEVADTEMDGQWTNILSPSFQVLVTEGLEQEIAVAKAHGAKVLLMTQPCADSGTQPDGSPWPQDDPQRLAIYNGIVKKVAHEEPASVSVFDLNALLCPGGSYTPTIEGYQVRTSDGIHLSVTGMPVVDPAIFPVVIKLGEEQRAADASKPRSVIESSAAQSPK